MPLALDAGRVPNREGMKTNYTHQLEEVYWKKFASAEIHHSAKILSGHLTCINVLDDKKNFLGISHLGYYFQVQTESRKWKWVSQNNLVEAS